MEKLDENTLARLFARLAGAARGGDTENPLCIVPEPFLG